MTLNRLHVDGFLQFHDYTMRFGDGVNVLHGPNEAGKSTLLWFIRYVLFGFQHHKRSARAMPLAGGRLGGSLLFGPDDLRVERFEKVAKVSAGGIPRGEIELAELLGQFDQAAFDAVFACDLDGLREMGALDDEGLRRRLFATTVLGVGVEIDQVEKRWKDRRSTLSKRGRHGVIYALERALREARGRLDRAREQSHALPGMLQKLERFDRSIAEHRRLLLQSRAEQNRLEAVIASREHLGIRAQLQDWFGEHPQPEHLAAVWQHRREQLRDAGLVLTHAREDEARLLAHREGLAADRDALEVDEAVLALGPGIQSLIEQAADLPDRRAISGRLRDARGALKSHLEAVGLEDLRGVDLSHPTRRHISELADAVPPLVELDALTRTTTKLKAQQEEAQRAVEQCEEPGAALGLEHRLQEIEQAEKRARDAESERMESEEELATLRPQRQALEEAWTRLPTLEETELERLQTRVSTWSEGRKTRIAELAETRRAIARCTRAVEDVRTPLSVQQVPSSLTQWADQRKAMTDSEARLRALRASEESARSALEKKLAEVPLIANLDELRACSAVPWTQVALLTARLQSESTRTVPRVAGPGEEPDRTVLVEQQHRGIQLHRQRDAARRWRFATRAMLVLVALLAIAGVVVWLAGTSAALVTACVLALVWLAVLGVELYLWSMIRRSSTELSDLGADDRDVWLADLGRSLARLELHDDQLRSLGASEAIEVERARDRETLDAHVRGVPILATAAWSALAELAARLPECLHSLGELDRFAEDAARLRGLLDAWVVAGQGCAAIGVEVPATLAEAHEAATAVNRAEEVARDQQVAEEARRRTLADKEKELADLRHREAELCEPVEQDAAVREAVRAAGGDDVAEAYWSEWLEAGLKALALDRRISVLETRLRTVAARLVAERRVVDDAFNLGGVTDLPTLRKVVGDAVQRQDELTKRQARLSDARRELRAHQEQVGAAREQADRRASAVAELRSALEASGWPIEKPQRVGAMIERLQAAHQSEVAHQALEEAQKSAIVRWDAWWSAVGELAGDLGAPPPELDGSLAWLRDLQARVRQARDADSQRRTLTRQLEQGTREHGAAVDNVRVAEGALRDVREASGVQTEEEALQQLEEARAWELRRDRLEELERLVRARLGDADLDDVEYKDLFGLEERVSQVTFKLDAAQAEVDDYVARRGILTRDIGVLEESADVVTAADEVNVLQERLFQAQLELAEIELAMRWLKEEYERYVRENQPAVLKRASDLLQRASDGTMEAVIQEQNRLYVRAPDGKPREPQELSRGSREMLYLVIRLALALEHAERTRVPILLDDVMVNQDPERARQIAKVLRVVGQQHQVILMTCRPEMRDLMLEVDPGTNVIELARFAGRAAPVGTARVEDEQDHPSSDDVVERVVAYLSHDWERRSAIMEGAGLSDAEWAHFRRLVPEHPSIEHNGGEKRGSAYRLASHR